jgi:two-component system cell cycle sensor histidine kinase/response regulator CckA
LSPDGGVVHGEADNSSTGGGPRRILVVDDEPVVREFVDRVLKGAGYATALAADGPSAIGLAEKGRFDLLLTDEMMPHMTGHELARRLRIADPSLKVLYLTGYSDRLFAEKGGLWEDEAFLDKPCSVDGLRQAVSLLLDGRLSSDSPVS